MGLRDNLVEHLTAGPASVEMLAGDVKADAAVVSRMLGQLRAVGMVSIDGGMVTLVSATPKAPWPGRGSKALQEPLERASRAEPAPVPEPQAEAPALRLWVYSDRALGIALGDTVVELDAAHVADLIDFLAGVRPLLTKECAS